MTKMLNYQIIVQLPKVLFNFINLLKFFNLLNIENFVIRELQNKKGDRLATSKSKIIMNKL